MAPSKLAPASWLFLQQRAHQVGVGKIGFAKIGANKQTADQIRAYKAGIATIGLTQIAVFDFFASAKRAPCNGVWRKLLCCSVAWLKSAPISELSDTAALASHVAALKISALRYGLHQRTAFQRRLMEKWHAPVQIVKKRAFVQPCVAEIRLCQRQFHKDAAIQLGAMKTAVNQADFLKDQRFFSVALSKNALRKQRVL